VKWWLKLRVKWHNGIIGMSYGRLTGEMTRRHSLLFWRYSALNAIGGADAHKTGSNMSVTGTEITKSN